jgi:hypothetical protein
MFVNKKGRQFFNGLKMKKCYKGFQNFLSVAFCLFLFMQPAFDEYDALIDTQLLSGVPAFEKPHPHDIALGGGDKYQALESNILAMGLPATNFFQELFLDSSPIFSPNEYAPLLRC